MKAKFNLNINLRELIEKVEVNILKKTSESVKSEYLYISGTTNVGCIKHLSKRDFEYKYFTKLAEKSISSDREKYFYKKVCREYPVLQNITCGLIDIEFSNNLYLMTFEGIEGETPLINDTNIYKYLEISNLISSIKYGQIKKWFPNPDFGLEFNVFQKKGINHFFYALESFVSIYKRQTNVELFKELLALLIEKQYSANTILLVEKLKGIIIDNSLFNYLDVNRHYSLRHGDFGIHNFLVDKNGGAYVIDWGELKVGPSWVDCAGLLGSCKYSFSKIKSLYLDNDKMGGHLEEVEKIFLVYTIIIVWITKMQKLEFDKATSQYLQPAIEYIETLSLRIVN